jgi:hypothetical protein
MLASAAVPPPDALGAGDCEAWRDGPLGQPTNALTSLGLVAAGAWVAARGRALPPGRRWRPDGYGVLLTAAGLGSVAYHGRGGAGSRRLHDVSLYSLVAATAAAEVAVVASRSHHPARSRGWPRPRHGSVVAAGLVAAPLAYLLGRTSSPTCRPTSRWQWHGAWHLLVAATLTAWAEGTLIRPDLASGVERARAAGRTLP